MAFDAKADIGISAPCFTDSGHSSGCFDDGMKEPSQADELITRRLREALALVDIRVLDHLIVADNHCMLFAARELIG